MPDSNVESSYSLAAFEAPSRKFSPEEWERILDSHTLTREDMETIRRDGIPSFIHQREARLSVRLRTFLERKCEWGFENTPAISQLILDDLSDDDD